VSDRKRARHRRQERARKRTARWEAEYAAARGRAERLTVVYRWCLAEMRRDTRAKVGAWWDSERFEPAIEALLKAARGSDPA
jgi:hypothetical protein